MQNQPTHRNIHCTAVTRLGRPCRAFAVHSTDPPRCVAHGGGSGKHGAPRGNKNAVKHGIYADGWARSTSMDSPTLKPLPVDQNQCSSWSSGQTSKSDMECQPPGPPHQQSLEQTEIPQSIDLEQTIITIIQDLYNKHFALSDYIDQHAEEMSLPEYSHLLALHAQMASRLGRLLRDMVAVSPDSDWLDEVLRQTNAELSVILGTDLT